MITIDSSVIPPGVNLNALKYQAMTAFGSHFIDCNQTSNGAKWTVYLDATVASAQATWDGVLTAHDGQPLPDPLAIAVAQAAADKGSTAIDSLTVAQATTYIQNNVTDLNSAKQALIIAVKYIGWMERRIRQLESKQGL